MKKNLLLLCMLLPIMASAMKIEKDEIDEFEYTRTLITSWEKLDRNKIEVRFRLQNNYQCLDFRFCYDDPMFVSEDNRLQFKSTTDSIVTFKSIGTYSSTHIGGYMGNEIQATYIGNLDYFKSNVARLMRIYFGHEYVDRKISEVDGRRIIRLYEMFTQAMKNEPGKTSFEDYIVKYLKRNRKSKTWDLVKEERLETVSALEINEIKSDWQKKSNDTYEYDVQFKKSE